jgi:hypothetical protein
MSKQREIIFRGRRKDTGEWVEGNYIHNKRKGEFHIIRNQEFNEDHFIYRESLQLKDFDEEFKDV